MGTLKSAEMFLYPQVDVMTLVPDSTAGSPLSGVAGSQWVLTQENGFIKLTEYWSGRKGNEKKTAYKPGQALTVTMKGEHDSDMQ